ncbi:MAG: threonine synthase [Myxococcota bacterium]
MNAELTPAWHFRCSQCGSTYERDEVRYLCPACAGDTPAAVPLRGVLTVELAYDTLAPQLDPRAPDWSLLVPVPRRFWPNYPVGNTPLAPGDALAATLGCGRLWLKLDGLNPSGSLKDRASFLVAAEARRLGERRVVTASTGNAASALAAVCAAAGLEALIFAPASAPRAKLIQMLVHGATLVPVDGSYDDAFALSIAYTRERGGLNRNTAYHPLTIEGKKTVALEMFAQLGGRAPGAVIVPVGDGVILAGVHKGFVDLQRLGLIDALPKLIGVQAESSDAIHHFVTQGTYRPAVRPHTVADSISVSAPSNAHLAKRAIEESRGSTLLVTDAEILAAQRALARTCGIFVEPAAAASVAGATKMGAQLAEDTVLLLTGHGLKDVDAAARGVELPRPVAPRLDALP